MSLLNALNEKQKEAASKIEGALLILAGAGSGKTRTVTYRIAHMIEELGISPYSILAVTFTNKAAKEMRERVTSLIGEENNHATISTFHSFGVRLLRIYGNKIGYNSNFSIYDTDDQKKIIRNIIKDFAITDDSLNPKLLISEISKAKENGIMPEDYEKENKFYNNSKKVAEIYAKYNEKLKQNNAIDFSDILINTMKLLKDPEILQKTQDRYRYIMVDEYQDTNEIQYNIIKTIANKYGNICVVGDENQSIYGFRGADIKNILNFEKDYPNAKIVKLEENYRSTSNILDAANNVIKNNKTSKDKILWTKNSTGDLINVIGSKSARDEVNNIIEIIAKEKNSGKKYKDFTILYRTNAQSRLFEEGFFRLGIPHKIFGGTQFYGRVEIKDILAYLSVIDNPLDEFNLLRIINVPKRKIGPKTIETLMNYAKENNLTLLESMGVCVDIPGVTKNAGEKIKELHTFLKEMTELAKSEEVSFIFDQIVKRINYVDYLKSNYEDSENRIENIEELRNSIVEMEALFDVLTLREYLENISLVSATDNLNEDNDYVKLMTIHNSKGLEFPVVFVVGFENEVFPGTSRHDPVLLEEERRLCYVAITRAEEKLFLSYSISRMIYGNIESRSRSIFIDEIPDNLRSEKAFKEFKFESDTSKKEDTPSNPINTKNFIKASDFNKSFKKSPYRVGEKLVHKKFGMGTVKKIDDKKVSVLFIDGERDIALAFADKFLSKP